MLDFSTENAFIDQLDGSTGKASSQASTITEQEQEMNKLEGLTLQLRRMTCERDELHLILARCADKDLNKRRTSEFEMLKTEHQKTMIGLKKLPKELSEALDKCKKLTEEMESCRILHSRHLSERAQLKQEIDTSRVEIRKLQREQIVLQQACEETKRLREEAGEKIYSRSAKQPQAQEGLEERLQDLLKQNTLGIQQRGSAEKMQHHCDVSEMRSEILHCDVKLATAQGESSLQTEALQQEH